MEKILRVAFVMSLIPSGHGLQITFDPLPTFPHFCGVLICTETISPTPIPTGFGDELAKGNISSLSIFRTFAATSDVKGQTVQTILRASLTSDKPTLRDVFDAMMVSGQLAPKKASLRLELVNKEDCQAEYICQVKMAGPQGTEFMSTARVLQQETSSKGETVVEKTLEGDFSQVIVQKMNERISSVESLMRYQDEKTQSLIQSLHARLETFESNVGKSLKKMNNKLSAVNNKESNVELHLQKAFYKSVQLLDDGLRNGTDRKLSCLHEHTLHGIQSWITQTHGCFTKDQTPANTTFTVEESTASLTPFKLSHSPSHVVNYVTPNISILCSHQESIPSQLQEVNRIRILKQFSSGWNVLAEMRDVSPEFRATLNVSVSGRISQHVEETFLKVIWPLAVPETFGTYRCEVIGPQRTTLSIGTEVTPELAIAGEEVTTNDMLRIFKQTRDELSNVVNATNKLWENINRIDKELATFNNGLNGQNDKVATLDIKIDSSRQTLDHVSGEVTNLTGVVDSLLQQVHPVSERVDKLEEDVEAYRDELTQNDALNKTMQAVAEEIEFLKTNDASLRRDLRVVNGNQINNELTSMWKRINETQSSVHANFQRIMSQGEWPAGHFALLQPNYGCPVDKAFFDGSGKHFKIHTESSTRDKSGNDFPPILPKETITNVASQNFFTLWFCEASDGSGKGVWPAGNYCINKLNTSSCPSGLAEANVDLDVEDTGVIHDFNSKIVTDREILGFCCMTSGDPATPIALPSRYPFVLYRRGNRCQVVQGMSVSATSISIDTEDSGNNDLASEGGPDIFLNKIDPLVLFLCYYTPE